MKAKKALSIVVVTVFFATVLICAYLLFNVKQIDTEYAIDQDTDVSYIDDTLNEYLNKNLLLINAGKIEQKLSAFPEFETLSVKKVFPNKLKVEIQERRPVYVLENQETVYRLDQSGFVINSVPKSTFNTVPDSMIELVLDGVELRELSVGKKLKTDSDTLVSSVFEMALSVRLTDCINTIIVKNDIDVYDADFYTDTGVVISVLNADERGVDKITTAFASYDNADDFYKSFDVIKVYEDVNGIVCLWTNKDKGVGNA